MRILLAGDWHGNRDWAGRVFEVAATHHADVVLQLGDFGLWPGREDAWLDYVDHHAAQSGTTLVWIDGNHENHAALDLWRADADTDGLVAMRERVRWATRGARWSWAGLSFGALGGAVSMDRFLRKAGINWWPQEATTQADVDRLGDRPLDVLVTHAAPTTTALPYRRLPLPDAIIADARHVKELLDQAVTRTAPRLVVHGHYHLRLHAEMDGRTVEGLAHDRSTPGDALALLDLEDPLVVRTP